MNGTNQIKQVLRTLTICSYGMDLKQDTKCFNIMDYEISTKTLLQEDTLAPVLISMADMLYESTQIDDSFKSFHPVHLIKQENSLCYVSLKPNNEFKLEESGFSLAVSSLYTLDTMHNLLMKNPSQKVDLENLVNVWRTELSEYKEGEIINIRDHKENLIDNNLGLYPKIRIDLQEQRKTNLRKGLFK